ncbi:tafazzin-like [Halichondria panicea]|uniref:tafazzin-like n=1 Tax=Halichondria panicea TaxID=6063 RepID=UPI00312B9B49
MTVDMDGWPFPKHRGLGWRSSSVMVKLCTSLVMKLLISVGQRVQTRNVKQLVKVVAGRPKGTPLVTVSNHASCIDDPAIWSVLPLKLCTTKRMSRWVPAAKELVFPNKLLSSFFSRSQLVPVVRGDGVYQQGVNFCLQLLNEGNWIHVFPEGKVNMNGNTMRLKWGVGRMVAESAKIPLVLPLWHVGMDDILPNSAPYIPRFFKKLTVYVGDPIDVSSIIKAHYQRCHTDFHANAVELRKQITDIIQQKMYELKAHAETLHTLKKV